MVLPETEIVSQLHHNIYDVKEKNHSPDASVQCA